ncbi:MAG: hypothetical protein AAF703_18120 [Cyanobacteria bacterium P01_D01_bin.105]
MPKDESMSRTNSDLEKDSHIKIRQLQQYLHRPGQIPAAPHPFVKQAIKQAAKQSVYPLKPQSSASPLRWIARWRDRLFFNPLFSQTQDPKSQNKSQNPTANNP